jgi:hypothetical protein
MQSARDVYQRSGSNQARAASLAAGAFALDFVGDQLCGSSQAASRARLTAARTDSGAAGLFSYGPSRSAVKPCLIA